MTSAARKSANTPLQNAMTMPKFTRAVEAQLGKMGWSEDASPLVLDPRENVVCTAMFEAGYSIARTSQAINCILLQDDESLYVEDMGRD